MPNQNLAWPDAELIVCDYLRTQLGVAITLVTNVRPADATVAANLPMVTARRAGGVRQGQLVDQPRVLITYYAATEQLAASGMALVRDLLRQMIGVVGGFRITRVDEFLGPTPVQDPDTQTPRQIMTVEALIRANSR